MSFLPYQRIADAIHATEREIGIIDSERTAYRRFRRRLESIDAANVNPATATNVPGVQTTVESVSVDHSLQAIREAYRETVMATQHYDGEYGESLREHVTAELGEAVATQVVEGDTFTPLLKETLYVKVSEAIEQRTELLKSLRAEYQSLKRCRDIVSDIQERLNEIHVCLDDESDSTELCTIDNQLVSLESRCEDILTRRQRHIDNRQGSLLADDKPGFAEYLYEDLESCFPVLTAVLECIKTVRRCRIRSFQ